MIGEIVAGRYRVVRALGRGSFGHTFLAVDTTNDHEVAIKQLHADGERGWKAFELFEREAAALREHEQRLVGAGVDDRDDRRACP